MQTFRRNCGKAFLVLNIIVSVQTDLSHHRALTHRCTFSWADSPPLEADEKGVPKPRVTDFESYMKTQKENFPNLHQVGAESMSLYNRVREAYFNQKTEDRDTFRTGIVYFIGLGFVDVWVSHL